MLPNSKNECIRSILFEPDGNWYEAVVVNSWRLKSSGEWRNQVKWKEGTWSVQTLNLSNEKWSIVKYQAVLKRYQASFKTS